VYIGDYLARRCVYTPDAVALVDVEAGPAGRLTYRALNERADRVAGWLRGTGVGRGDRVAMLDLDGVLAYDLFFACGKLGAVFAPLNWRLSPVELEAQLRLVEPSLLVHGTGDPLDALVAHLRTTLPELWSLPTTSTSEPDLAAVLRDAPAVPVACESLTEHDTACLLFTGGTTGRAKAAEISHGQIVWNTFNCRLGDVRETDVFLNIFPLFHAGGLFAFSVPLLILGGRVVQTRRFDAAQVLKLIEEEDVTIFGGVPTVFGMLASHRDWAGARIDSLRFCMSGGAPMPVPLIRRYQEEKGVVFRQGFGMTEFGPGVFSLAAEDAERRAGSIGKPNFFVDARIVDPETGAALPPGAVGELRLRGPSAMRGYFRDPDATAAAFDSDGYLRTGDLARVDDDGYFYIVDRLKEMFISGGENVYPAEVEAVLYRHPAVAQCAVVGVPDERWGEVGRAWVVLHDGHRASEAELIAHATSELARYKVPKSVVFVRALPISGAGKILKQELREQPV
jgi:fatty-acyl-CoA synthase